MRILIVEDETKVAHALSHGLEREFYDVVVASNGEEGFYRANSETFDLIILDVMLPGRDGFEILTALRKAGAVVPILVLTARDTIDDRVTGLDGGADDYLVKPFAFPELLARIRVLLRRARPDVLRLRFADLELDVVTAKLRERDRCSICGRASSSCSNTSCAIRNNSCRGRCSRAMCGRPCIGARRSTTSLMSISHGCVGRWMLSFR